jgi:predicted glycoside hydrolase/deacetylase ChbG (UPF0249 family)
MVKWLFVTADDLGLNSAVNLAIRAAFDGGLATSAALLVNAPLVSEAVALAKRPPRLPCGVHLTLTCGRPVSPPGEVQSLTDRHGRFPPLPAFLARYAAGAIRLAEVEREWRAQCAEFLRHAGPPASLSSHHHLHLLPRLYALALRLAAEYHVPWLRPRREVAHPGRRALGAGGRLRDALTADGAKSAAFQAVLVYAAARRGPPAAPATGFLRLRRLPGIDLVQSLRRLLICLPPGRFELVCHPAYADPAWPQGRRHAGEVAALGDPGVRELCARLGIGLLSPADPLPGPLVPAAGRAAQGGTDRAHVADQPDAGGRELLAAPGHHLAGQLHQCPYPAPG